MAEQQIKFKNLYSPRSIDTGGAERMQALQRLAGQVGDVAFEIGKQKRIEEGELAGVEAAAKAVETGEYEKPSSFTFFGQAAQDSFQRTYASKINNQMTQELTAAYEESKVQANPLEYFEEVTNGYKSGLNQGVSADLRPVMDATYASVQSTFKTQLIGDAIKREQADAKAANAQLYQTTLVQAQAAALAGDTQALQQLQLNYETLLTTDNTLTTQERITLTNDFTYQVQLQQSIGGVRQIYRDKGIGEANDFIETIESQNLGLQPGEQDKLVDAARDELTSLIKFDDAEQDRLDYEKEQLQDDNFQQLFLGMLKGTTTLDKVLNASTIEDIDNDQFESLINALQKQGTGFDDQTVMASIDQLILTDPTAALNAIKQANGISLTQGTASTLMVSAMDRVSKESILNSATAKRFKSNLTQIMQVAKDGVLYYDKPELSTEISMIYDERVLAGENPKIVALELMAVFTELDEPFEDDQPIYANFSNFKEAQAKLVEDYRKKMEVAQKIRNDQERESQLTTLKDEANDLEERLSKYYKSKRIMKSYEADLKQLNDLEQGTQDE
mgnify:CR=1 FL=1|tara:strand:+ start:3643 stop:5322 length:1680 start_codon:yes stop_codon:yes gene_type:complete